MLDRDDSSDTGDWEILFHLCRENPGKICPKTSAIEAQTLSGLSVAAAEDVISKMLDRDDSSDTGDWEILFHLCRENPGKICPKTSAIEAQTLSGLSVAAAEDVISKMLDRDDSSDTGDWEILFHLCRENPGKICPKTSAIEAQTLSGLSVAAAEDVISKMLDRDDSSDTGDWEILFHLCRENPGKICPKTSAIEAQTLSGLSVAAAEDVISK
ncbi:uncharacterized protein si:dkey-205h13.2 isoform X2 [Acanthochromis polyacanthus]|uniref:uncharacterized protein si:dkey-205h13.2 isoform X2 n=1 Tax=Acanthochromis polyacanthus TaxID=80966 RepID=UPI002234A50F|nr:uncharacterized protein si:dkey-205h13.2 isoform X2 [Acanthochromis polyacanthus]